MRGVYFTTISSSVGSAPHHSITTGLLRQRCINAKSSGESGRNANVAVSGAGRSGIGRSHVGVVAQMGNATSLQRQRHFAQAARAVGVEALHAGEFQGQELAG